MMDQFDFTDIIIAILYHIFLRYFCLSDVLVMANIILYCSKRYTWLSDSDIQRHQRGFLILLQVIQMKTKYSACSGEASPWISHEILRASGIEGYK